MYFSESKVVATLLLLFGTIILIRWACVKFLPDIRYLRGWHYVRIFDVDGRKANFTLQREIIIHKPSVRELQMPDISASGSFKVCGSNLGKTTRETGDGGKLVIITRLDSQLVPHKKIIHRVEADVFDSYTETRESVTATIYNSYSELNMYLQVPAERPIRMVYCTKIYKTTKTKIPVDDLLLGNRTFVHVVIRKPKVGAVYVLEWDW